MALSFAAITTIIETGIFEPLIGELEGDHLDAKGHPYQFNSPGNHAKRELAKDITAFANANGGYIIIGLTTKPAPAHPTEQITSIKPIPRTQINTDQYYKLINEWIFPQPTGVTITLHDHGTDPTHAIGIITVPTQDHGNKPFLITKTVDETKTTDITIGYAERRRDTTKNLTVVELQHALRLGLNMERTLVDRLDNIEELLQQHFTTQSVAQTTKDTLLALKLRIGRITGNEIVNDTPRLILTATPVGDASLRTILSNNPTSIRRTLQDPPSIRSRGWSLNTGDTPQLSNGQYLHVEDTREVINLYRDGTLIMAGRIDKNFLAWSDKTNRDLHPLALIELLTNATIFYQQVINDLTPAPGTIMLGLDLQHLHQHDTPITLPAGGMSGQYGFWGHRAPAPANDWHTRLTTDTTAYDPAHVAYGLLRELYAWFGHTEEDIPYTTGEHYDKRISIDTIKAMG